MVKKSKGDLSKRCTLRKKYSILRHVRDYRRDVRRAIKRTRQPKRRIMFADETAILKMPNKNSQKRELLESIIAHRERKRQGKTLQRKESEESSIPEEITPTEEQGTTENSEEQADFTLQLARCMDVSDALVYVVDARAPQASISETITALWRSTGVPIVLLLNKHKLVPEVALAEWIAFFRQEKLFDHVMAYQGTDLIDLLQKFRGAQDTLTTTVFGFANTGLNAIRDDVENIQSKSLSVHNSHDVQKQPFVSSHGVRLVFPPQPIEFLSQPIFGLDCIFREWKNLVQLKEVDFILYTEEVLKNFPTAHLTLHYKLANEAELSPNDILTRVQQRRGYKNLYQAARDVLSDYHSGKLHWCCVPKDFDMRKKLAQCDGWTFIDESLLCTQDMVFDGAEVEMDAEQEEEEE